jgi:hypothetical protein
MVADVGASVRVVGYFFSFLGVVAVLLKSKVEGCWQKKEGRQPR